MSTPDFPAVNVGQTDYPLRPNATSRGPLSHDSATPPSLRTAPNDTPGFRLLDGPPYANGVPHLGHVLNKHLKDAVARAAHATGHTVEWRPGWDCHGLPLELAVERTGVDRSDRLGFVAAARTFATGQALGQAEVFHQQGWSADWSAPWRTHDPQMEAGTLRVLADLLDRGHVQTRFAAVPWCPRCQSTLSGAEQEPRALTSEAWLVPFTLEDGDQVLSWTTTPWTLPLHRALVVDPFATYVALTLGDERAWVSRDTAEHWAVLLGATRLPFERTGSELAGRAYRTPWTTGQVVADPRALSQAGTGVLHAVPGLAELDTALARDHDWTLVQHLSTDGRVLASPCAEQNQTFAGAQPSQEPVRAAYAGSPWCRVLPHQVEHPHCWRHHVPLLTRASRQVFLVLDEQVRQRAAHMVDQLTFTPEAGRARLAAAMAARPDWCLSRQRTWGVPLALFLDRATGQPHASAATWMRRTAEAMETQGVEAWWRQPSSAWVQNEADLDTLDRVDDVLDVWFDSGCVPQLVGAGDVVVEGTDQHRGWFQSCLWVAAALGAPLPFKRVATHGFVLGADGLKLSKSTGGDSKGGRGPAVPPPWHQLPTDVVRLWALTGSEGHDKVWSQATVQAAQGAVARLRGVLRFLLANTLVSPTLVDPKTLPVWDRYWWKATVDMADRALALCAQARTGEALSQVMPFADTFSSVVLGAWKDRLYCAPPSSPERQALELALRGCLAAWGRLLSVLMPRAVADAQAWWPTAMEQDAVVPFVSPKETAQVEQVLAAREALLPTLEAMSQAKGGPTTRRVAASPLPTWPGQLLAAALGVGQVGDFVETLTPVPLASGLHLLAVGLSPDPVCARCRRPQPEWKGGCCAVCVARTQFVKDGALTV